MSDSFACFGDSFLPTGISRPALIRGFVPSLIKARYAMFGSYPWEACPFLKRNRGGVAGRDWEERKERKLIRMRKEEGGGKGREREGGRI